MSDRYLTVTSRTHSAGPHVLTVAGELDHHTAPRLHSALDESPLTPGTSIILDLSGLTYCDSTGITVLITAHHRAQATGGGLALAGLDDDIKRVFTIVGLDQIFAFHDSVDDAAAALTR
ncbi:STAS domain-containing protein [Streptomyces glaucosporus]|uniref:Anti-sigma factor antagonist n=1 Tax=Streptomyces glaucosporus TaxID=284044 RepID=A0ABP5VVW0_9ACTN